MCPMALPQLRLDWISVPVPVVVQRFYAMLQQRGSGEGGVGDDLSQKTMFVIVMK